MKQVFLTVLLFSVLFAKGAPLEVVHLRVNLQANPTGVTDAPKLSWKLISNEKGKHQRGYHILAATSLEKLTEETADLWSSKVLKSAAKHLISWKGKKLDTNQQVFWKVRVWDESDTIGEWSKPANFVVGGQKSTPIPARISHFESSSPELNQLYTESITELERRITSFSAKNPSALGSGAEVHRSARALLYHFDSAPHLSEWLSLMDRSMNDHGFFPIHPATKKVGPISSDAAIIVHHPVWWMSGDSGYPKARWAIYEKYMMAREKLDPKFKGKKWGEIGDTEGATAEFLDLCYLGFTTRLVRELAIPAEQPLNAIRFQDFASRIQKSFQAQYLDGDGSLKVNSQTAQVLALRSAVLTPEQQITVTSDLMKSLTSEGLKVGPIGAHFLPGVLSLTNNHNTAIKLLTNLKEGDRKQFIETGISEWLMSFVAGIDASIAGFTQLIIAPRIPFDDSLKWVKAHYESQGGTIAVHWQQLPEGGLKVDITIPPSALARIDLPVKKGQSLTEDGKSIHDAPAIEILRQTDTSVSLVSQSGQYSLLIK
ncbi:MAG: hypothetical protein ACJAVK_002051 [Akkermansiaceae bacterium]|jgi:hypothetical protein